MKIYLASRYTRFEEMQGYRTQLQTKGHTVTSRWINGEHQASDASLMDTDKTRLAAGFAQEDWEDIFKAQCMIAFTEPPRSATGSRGGRHVEFGIALARQMQVIVVGHRENVFYTLPQVQFYETWDAALESI